MKCRDFHGRPVRPLFYGPFSLRLKYRPPKCILIMTILSCVMKHCTKATWFSSLYTKYFETYKITSSAGFPPPTTKKPNTTCTPLFHQYALLLTWRGSLLGAWVLGLHGLFNPWHLIWDCQKGTNCDMDTWLLGNGLKPTTHFTQAKQLSDGNNFVNDNLGCSGSSDLEVKGSIHYC